MLPADIFIQNDSASDIVLTHVYTEDGDNGSKASYRGKPSYWKSTPPEVGLRIPPGQSAGVGIMDTVTWWDSPSWIFLEYAGTSSNQLQVFVDMQGPNVESKGVWASVGPADAKSTEDNPMPRGRRPELVVYDLDRSPNWSVTVHIPPAASWKYLDPPAPQAPDDTGKTAVEVINVALSTLITVCFVIPPAAEIGVALQAMSTAGKAAVALTAAQGVLGIFTAPSRPQVPRAFGSEQAYAANKLTQKEWVENKLRLLMDKYQTSFHHTDDRGGIESRLKAVADKVRAQLGKARGVVVEDDMLGDMKQCLEFFDDITNQNKAFQTAILDCIDTGPLTEDVKAPPDKLKLALGFAGLSMTLTAYSNAYAIRSFVAASENAEKLIADLKLDRVDADNIYDYMSGQINLVQKLDIAKAATSYRLGLVKFSTDTVEVLEGIPGPAQVGSVSYPRMVVSDAGVESASWGFVSLDDADDFMTKKHAMEEAGGFVSGQPRQWHAKDHFSHRGARDGTMFELYMAYSQFLSDRVALDVSKAVGESLTEFKDAIIPYMAGLRTPLAPFDPDMKIELQSGTDRVLAESFQPNFVQYGFAYANSRTTESPMYWHDPVSLAAAGDGRFPTGTKLTIPKDPLNLRAAELAEKAKTVQVAAGAQLGAAISPLSLTKPLSALPSHVSASRHVYRRFGMLADELKAKASSEGEMIKKLGVFDEDVFVDAWNEKTGAPVGT